MRPQDELQDVCKAKVEAFLGWFEQLGGSFSPSFEYAQDAEMGLSIFTREEQGPDIQAISVPKECCITADLACRRILTLLGRDEQDRNTLTGKEWVVLYLFLHRVVISTDAPPAPFQGSENPSKRQRVEDTSLQSFPFHSSYICLLPEETLTPLHFYKNEIELLKSTPLYGHAIESRRNGRESCIKAVKWLLSGLNKEVANAEWIDSLADSLKVPESILKYDRSNDGTDLMREFEDWGEDERQWAILKEWRWAETAYGSRAFPPRLLGDEFAATVKLDAPILIPGLDAFNHSRQAKVTWTFHSHPSEHVTLTLHQPLKKGDQVFNSYGPKSNEDLLASYGFVNDRLEDDTVTLKLGGQQPASQVQQHYWRYDEPCPSALLEEVRTALNSTNDRQDNTIDCSPVKLLEEEGEAMDIIVNLLEQKIASFDATQEAVDDLEGNKTAAVRDSVRRNISIYRKGQSRILHSALQQSLSHLAAIEERLNVVSSSN